MMCGTIQRTLRIKTMTDTKIKFYKVMAIPVLTHASETWAITGKEKQRVQTAEMNFLRHVSGYRLRDRMRNEHIRIELGIFSINDKIEERK